MNVSLVFFAIAGIAFVFLMLVLLEGEATLIKSKYLGITMLLSGVAGVILSLLGW